MLPKMLYNAVRAMSSNANNFKDAISQLRPLAIGSQVFDKMIETGSIKHIANVVYINRPLPQKPQIFCRYDAIDMDGVDMSWSLIRKIMGSASERAQGFFEAYRAGSHNVIVVGRKDQIAKMTEGDMASMITLEEKFGKVYLKSNESIETYIPVVCYDDDTAAYVLECMAQISCECQD